MSALKVIQVPAAFNTAGLNIVWILVGLIAIYAGIKNLLDEENPSRIGTAIFWCSFGIVTALGTWLPAKVSGVLVIIMCLPPIFKKVKVGKTNAPEKAHTEAQFKKIGMKIFVPAFCVAVFSLAFSLFSNMSSMIAITLGVLVAIIFLVAYDSKENKPQVFLKDSERFLSLTGPLSMLPQLLGCLGGVFTAAGVGEVIAQIVEKVVPKGNVNIGIIVYAVGMVLFTMIMGNAFAAITVMTGWYRCSVRTGIRCKSGSHRYDRTDLRLLRNLNDSDGSKLQYRTGCNPEYEGPLGRNQKSGAGWINYACIPDLLYDSIKVNRQDRLTKVIVFSEREGRWP